MKVTVKTRNVIRPIQVNSNPIVVPSTIGIQGPEGIQGPAGPIGRQGIQGPMGPMGPMGPAGPMGPIGPQGLQGIRGDLGERGPQGIQGPIGPMGLTRINLAEDISLEDLQDNSIIQFNADQNKWVVKNILDLDVRGLSTISEVTKRLQNPVNIALSGAVNGTIQFDGSSDISIETSMVQNTELKTGSLLIEETYQIDTALSSSVDINTYLVDEFDITQYRTAKYLAQITSGEDYHATELLVIHNDNVASITEYGTVYTNDTPLGFFDTLIQNGKVRLLFTPEVAGSVIKVIRHTIKAT